MRSLVRAWRQAPREPTPPAANAPCTTRHGSPCAPLAASSRLHPPGCILALRHAPIHPTTGLAKPIIVLSREVGRVGRTVGKMGARGAQEARGRGEKPSNSGWRHDSRYPIGMTTAPLATSQPQ